MKQKKPTGLTVNTDRPDKYLLVNSQDGTMWRGTARGWVPVDTGVRDMYRREAAA
jgi:hypothetical protein